MYAIIRKNNYDPGKLAQAGPALAEFQTLHAAQPGYAGSIDIDTGQGQRIIVNLWQTEQDARAGMTMLASHVERLLGPVMAGPSHLVGFGEVAASDLTPRHQASHNPGLPGDPSSAADPKKPAAQD